MGCIAIDIISGRSHCFSTIKSMCDFVKYGSNRALSNLLKAREFVYYNNFKLKRNDYGA